MYPNEIQAIRKLLSAIDVAVNSLDVLKSTILEVQPDATKLAGAVDDDIARARQLQTEANELFGKRFDPPSHSKIARHARTALLSLAGPIDESDIQAAKERLRMIIDMIDLRDTKGPTTLLPSEEIIAFLWTQEIEWFVTDDGEVLVLEHTCDFVSNTNQDGTPNTSPINQATTLHPVYTVDHARELLDTMSVSAPHRVSGIPAARYNSGISEYSPDKAPRLPNCPHYMSGWNDAARDYAAEMRQELRP